MAKKTIHKELVTMEDLAQGVGKVTQQRAGKQYPLGMIDVPYAVTSIESLKSLDVSKFTKAKFNNVVYEYVSDDVTGIVPDSGVGSWHVSIHLSALSVGLDQNVNLQEWANELELLVYVTQGPWSEIAGKQVTEDMRTHAWTFNGRDYGIYPSVQLPVTAPSDPTTQPDVWRVVSGGASQGWVRDNFSEAVDIRAFGAIGDARNSDGSLNPNPTNDTQAIKKALLASNVIEIPVGKSFMFDETLVLKNKKIIFNGELHQFHDGIGLHLLTGNRIEVGPGERHVVRRAPTFSSDTACCVLLYHNSIYGCRHNVLPRLIVENGFIDYSTNAQGILDPAKCEGKAFWLLAGDTHGIATEAAKNENTYLNDLSGCRADGFSEPYVLEADLQSLSKDNGWVNGNTLNNISMRRYRRGIQLLCPLENDDSTKLDGEVSGNFILGVDSQYSSNLFESALVCNGRNNQISFMQWDTPEDHYPVFIFTKRDPSKPYGFNEPAGNILTATGINASLDSRAVFEISPGFNVINSNVPRNQNILPVNPIGVGQREDQSYIGVVENYIGLKSNVANFQAQKLNEFESIVGDITVADEERMFNPEQELYGSIPVTADTYGVNLIIDFNQTSHIQLVGFTLAYKEFVAGSVDFDYYDNNFQKIGTVESTADRSSCVTSGGTNFTNVKRVRIKIRINQDGFKTGSIKVSNLFVKAYNKRNDQYHVRRDQDQTITGDLTFNGENRSNNIHTFASLPVFLANGGTKYRLTIAPDGTLGTQVIP